MTRARPLLPLAAILWLGGCGAPSDPLATDNGTAPSNNVAVPQIANVGLATNAADPEPASALPDKPLVSRETSPAVPPRAAMPVYRAIGTEPFWAVTIRGSVATLERPDKPPMRFAVARSDDARAIRYLGDGFTLTLTPGPCSDGMSEAIWSDRAQVAFGEGTLKGCGGDREDMP